jgi:hypothetical protein
MQDDLLAVLLRLAATDSAQIVQARDCGRGQTLRALAQSPSVGQNLVGCPPELPAGRLDPRLPSRQRAICVSPDSRTLVLGEA